MLMYCDPPKVIKPTIRADRAELAARNSRSNDNNAIIFLPFVSWNHGESGNCWARATEDDIIPVTQCSVSRDNQKHKGGVQLFIVVIAAAILGVPGADSRAEKVGTGKKWKAGEEKSRFYPNW